MTKEQLIGGSKSVSGSRQRRVGKRVVTFSSVKATQSCSGIKVHLKHCESFPRFFVTPCAQSIIWPHVHLVLMLESLYFVAIPFDHSRKKRVTMQKVNVSHGKSKMDKTVRRGELPWVRHSRTVCRRRVVRSAVPMSMKKKWRWSKEEANKKIWRKKWLFVCSLKISVGV
jgi:hypothetical protein